MSFSVVLLGPCPERQVYLLVPRDQVAAALMAAKGQLHFNSSSFVLVREMTYGREAERKFVFSLEKKNK